MKFYHYALFFVVICIGFFMTAHITTVLKLQEECVRKTEYDCLVSAVNAAVDVVYSGSDARVTEADLVRAEEVFFQTLEVLWYGTTDRTTWGELRTRIPCIVVFAEDGYYRYCFEKEKGYMWSEMVPYEQGRIPTRFFEETEKLLADYHNAGYTPSGKYRVEQAEEGIWEREIAPLCVFAIYAPIRSKLSNDRNGFMYAASIYQQIAYYVTADNRCHLPFCKEYTAGKLIGCYATQKESAEAGAIPCERCMR